MHIPAEYNETILTPEASRGVEAHWSYVATCCGESTVLPDGRCDLILRFNIQTDAAPVPVMTGPATRPYHVQFSVGDAWVGVRLRPGSGALLWRHRIAAARDTVIRGNDVYSHVPHLRRLSDAAPAVSTIAESLSVMPELTEAAAVPARVTRAISLIHLSGGRIRIEDLAKSLACSTRHLNRSFSSSVGLATKDYARLVQFHRALALIRHETLTLADAAFESGYADQSHLSRAFQRFGGFSPGRIPGNLTAPGFLN